MPDRARRRAIWFTAVLTLIGVWETADLLMMGHTTGWAIFGPVTAALAAIAGGVSLAYLATRRRRRIATIGLIALWLFVALAGYEGFSAHRHAVALGFTDTQAPAVAPLLFTVVGIAGATILRYGTKGR